MIDVPLFEHSVVTYYYYIVFRKKWYICFFSIYFSQFLDKFYETFSEYPYANMSTGGNLILRESVKHSLCSYVIMTFFCKKNHNSDVFEEDKHFFNFAQKQGT